MSGDPVVFWELASHDEEKSAEFFRQVFGWDVAFDKELGFQRVNSPGAGDPGRGYIFTLKQAKLPFLAIYIRVADVAAKRDLVLKHGGSIVIEPTTIGDSRICLFNEPSGVTFAMIEGKPAS